jgi:hypothetical protein
MSKKTYQGSCHCKAITFEADLDFAEGTHKCNCTFCFKNRWWTIKAKPEGFRAKTGAELLSKYKPDEETGHSGFCTKCGVRPYAWVEKSEWNEAQYVSVSVAALDDVDPVEMIEAPVTYYDGLHNNWWNKPAETRHL